MPVLEVVVHGPRCGFTSIVEPAMLGTVNARLLASLLQLVSRGHHSLVKTQRCQT